MKFEKHYQECVTVRAINLRRHRRRSERREGSGGPISHSHNISSFIHSLSYRTNTIQKHQKRLGDPAFIAYLSQIQSSVVVLITANTANMRKPPTCLQPASARN